MKAAAAVVALLVSLAGGFAMAAEPVIGQDGICKAAVAAMMGRNPKIMTIDRREGGIVHLSYIRKDDGSHWAYRCRLEGDRVIWASDTGRWRTHPADEKILYSVSDAGVTITQAWTDGSKSVDTFPAAVLTGK